MRCIRLRMAAAALNGVQAKGLGKGSDGALGSAHGAAIEGEKEKKGTTLRVRCSPFVGAIHGLWVYVYVCHSYLDFEHIHFSGGGRLALTTLVSPHELCFHAFFNVLQGSGDIATAMAAVSTDAFPFTWPLPGAWLTKAVSGGEGAGTARRRLPLWLQKCPFPRPINTAAAFDAPQVRQWLQAPAAAPLSAAPRHCAALLPCVIAAAPLTRPAVARRRWPEAARCTAHVKALVSTCKGWQGRGQGGLEDLPFAQGLLTPFPGILSALQFSGQKKHRKAGMMERGKEERN